MTVGMETDTLSLQQKFAPKSICFGCGPANQEGLHINSFPEGDTLVCEWNAEPKYWAFPGVLYGGLVGSLLDCHCNWASAWHLMNKHKMDSLPSTVTAEHNIKFLHPTPTDKPLRLVARVVQSGERSATIDGELYSGDKLTATCRSVFVAVKPGHPAYYRWE